MKLRSSGATSYDFILVLALSLSFSSCLSKMFPRVALAARSSFQHNHKPFLRQSTIIIIIQDVYVFPCTVWTSTVHQVNASASLRVRLPQIHRYNPLYSSVCLYHPYVSSQCTIQSVILHDFAVHLPAPACRATSRQVHPTHASLLTSAAVRVDSATSGRALDRDQTGNWANGLPTGTRLYIFHVDGICTFRVSSPSPLHRRHVTLSPRKFL